MAMVSTGQTKLFNRSVILLLVFINALVFEEISVLMHGFSVPSGEE